MKTSVVDSSRDFLKNAIALASLKAKKNQEGMTTQMALMKLGQGTPEYAAQKERALIGARREAMGGVAPILGKPSMDMASPDNGVLGGNQPQPEFVERMDSLGKVHVFQNKPLNPLQQQQLTDRQTKNKEAEALKETQGASARQAGEEMIQSIQEAEKTPQYFGPAGDLPTLLTPSAYLGEYGKRANWEANVNKLLSQKVIDVMNEMKRVSKTGATGFGQLNRSELELLRGASTVLNRRLDPQTAMKYLKQMEGIYQKVLNPSGGGGVPSWASSDPEGYLDAKKNNYTEEEIKDWFSRNALAKP